MAQPCPARRGNLLMAGLAAGGLVLGGAGAAPAQVSARGEALMTENLPDEFRADEFRDWAAGAASRTAEETIAGLKSRGFACDRYDDPALLGESGGAAAWFCTRSAAARQDYVSIVLAKDGSVLKSASGSSQKGI